MAKSLTVFLHYADQGAPPFSVEPNEWDLSGDYVVAYEQDPAFLEQVLLRRWEPPGSSDRVPAGFFRRPLPLLPPHSGAARAIDDQEYAAGWATADELLAAAARVDRPRPADGPGTRVLLAAVGLLAGMYGPGRVRVVYLYI